MLSFNYQQFDWQPKRHFQPDMVLSPEENKDQVFQIVDDV